MLLAVVWLWQGNSVGMMAHSVTVADTASAAGQQIHPWFPSITGLGAIAFLAGTVLLFAGVEVQGARASLADHLIFPNPSAALRMTFLA